MGFEHGEPTEEFEDRGPEDIGAHDAVEQMYHSSIYPYDDEIIVELTYEADGGTLVVNSFQFEPVTDNVVTPTGNIPVEWRATVFQALSENEYQVEDATPR